jgi:hypothetical protein
MLRNNIALNIIILSHICENKPSKSSIFSKKRARLVGALFQMGILYIYIVPVQGLK